MSSPPRQDSPIKPWHSIRVRILAAAVLLAVSGLGFAASDLRDALHAWRSAMVTRDLSATMATLSRATIEMSLERSVSQVSIEIPGRIEPAMSQLIQTQRAKSNEGLEATVAMSRAVAPGPVGDAFRDAIAALRDQLAPLRRGFDDLAAVPAADRPADQVENLPRAMKALIGRLQSLRHLLRGPGLQIPSDMAIMEQIRDKAWEIREYGGRERTYLAIATVLKTQIPATRLVEMVSLAQRVDDAWLDIGHLSRHDPLPAGLLAAVDTVAREYFGDYAKLRQTLLTEAAKPAPTYPIDFPAFFAQSSHALGRAENLSAAASDAIASVLDAGASATLRHVVVVSALMAVLLALSVGCATLVMNTFRRLGVLRVRMESLAGGDLRSDVPHVGRADEIGVIARATLVFRQTALEREELEARMAAAKRAQQERHRAAIDQYTQDFTASLGGVMHGLAAAAERMSTASGAMAETAGRTGDLARDTTESAQASARDLSTIAAATEQLSASIGEISGQVAASASTARAMGGQADVTERAMAGLSAAAQRVDSVAKLIGDIAGQTNLLSLNATIEAARAGEAGKGFAVVANEVKQLATRAATATAEIGAQIGAIQVATADAVTAVRQMAADVRRMEENAGAIAASVEQQGAGVREIAASIGTATRMTQDAVMAIGEVAEAAAHSRATSADVHESAAGVSRESMTLSKEVAHFLGAIQANSDERRLYWRLDGHDTPVRLSPQIGSAVSGRLIDISAGGMAVRLDRAPEAGQFATGSRVQATLIGPSASTIEMRVVRCVDQALALVALQERGVEERLEQVIQQLTPRPRAA